MLNKIKKPSWDEYFMMLADVVKSRADCVRRQVGAVIVKDKRIIATGYNGTPRNVTNCLDGGCIRCKRRQSGELKSGESEESCICIHAEQKSTPTRPRDDCYWDIADKKNYTPDWNL